MTNFKQLIYYGYMKYMLKNVKLIIVSFIETFGKLFTLKSIPNHFSDILMIFDKFPTVNPILVYCNYLDLVQFFPYFFKLFVFPYYFIIFRTGLSSYLCSDCECSDQISFQYKKLIK